MKLEKNGPILKNIILGWILSTTVNLPQQRVSTHTITSVDKNLEALWKLDEFTAPITHLSENDEHRDKFFMETTH